METNNQYEEFAGRFGFEGGAMKKFCASCKTTTLWKEGIALVDNYSMSPDFFGDDPNTMKVGTVNPDGSVIRVAVLKCVDCGRSHGI